LLFKEGEFVKRFFELRAEGKAFMEKDGMAERVRNMSLEMVYRERGR